jgi:hypothetical protein
VAFGTIGRIITIIRRFRRGKQKLHIHFLLKKKSRNGKTNTKNTGTNKILQASKKYHVHLMAPDPLTWFAKKLNAHLWKKRRVYLRADNLLDYSVHNQLFTRDFLQHNTGVNTTEKDARRPFES